MSTNETNVTIPTPSASVDATVRAALPRLADLREAAGVSQAFVAARCGVTRFAVSRWESGERVPTGFTASALAVVLDELGAFDGADR